MAGQSGVERQYDALLRGQDGAALDQFDRHGRLVSSTIEREPRVGRDLVLTIDPRLQRSAELLLDGALARRVSVADQRASDASGGAIIVMDVHSGAILAAASAPRFEPAAFAEHDAAAIERTLSDPAHPLFDRAIQMAIPPGSVFKTVTALALLDAPAFDPARPFDCQGYLDSPEGRRCMIYRRYGIGHGPVTLVDALAQSCNVYFFHHADWLGDAPLVDWGHRTGFGDRTGIDLPGEAAGHLPAAEPEPTGVANRQPRHRDAAESLAIGQGSLTATPIQVVRMMAAIANGGQLVTPHVAEGLGLAADPDASSDQAGIRGDRYCTAAFNSGTRFAKARNRSRGAAARRGRSEGNRPRHNGARGHRDRRQNRHRRGGRRLCRPRLVCRLRPGRLPAPRLRRRPRTRRRRRRYGRTGRQGACRSTSRTRVL